MDRKIKIMVGSTVYGIEDDLSQIVGLLRSMGYEVLNSHGGTIKVNPALSNLENCLNAVNECDLFLGFIRPYYGTGNIGERNITFEEIKRAIELKKPYWFMVHRDVVFARKLFKKLRVINDFDNSRIPSFVKKVIRKVIGDSKIILDKNTFFDDRCIAVYDYVIKNSTEITQRTGNWVQEFYRIDDMLTYINTQFGDKNFVESILKQGE